MVNALTRKTGLTLGPIILETLVKHYFERVLKDHDGEDSTTLRKEELLYDEAFNIIKSFMEASTKHTVEELQAFSNTRTPTPPWVHSVRLLVPMSCCDDAATHLINALGGEQVTKRVVGGTKWWQVRGVKGVDAEWIVAKKDWQEAKRRQKTRGMSMDDTAADNGDSQQEPSPEYQPEMDQMRCILYAHGGGYYFGSIDQERYSMQRLARKINGRLFAINYRLAPQYPFPCAIQDLLAAYLYLISPPPGALHAPVSPSNIVFGGDSAGGGLCIATLQVIRDSGLPPPAGAVLISPWCDLTHSFPSVHLNTATDIIPSYGLSFHKPSTLWPPPPDDVTTRVHHSLRERIRKAVRPSFMGSNPDVVDMEAHLQAPPLRSTTPEHNVSMPVNGHTLYLGSVGSVPMATDRIRSQRVSVATPEGDTLAIDAQIHMYAPNYLLTHPLVSPVVSYLGGLPPLFVIASDKEVIRDEIIYFAHKAAHPDQYPVKPEARVLYPVLEGIEQRHEPTKVHLQVYDDCAHTLPVLFAFTTPGKYCFRAMAAFIKYATGMLPPRPSAEPIISEAAVTQSPMSTQINLTKPSGAVGTTTNDIPSRVIASQSDLSFASRAQEDSKESNSEAASTGTARSDEARLAKSVRRAISSTVTRASGLLRRHTSTGLPSPAERERDSSQSSDVGGPRFHQHKESPGVVAEYHTGEPSVYVQGMDMMIRERISTHGVIRPLEPESELAAFQLPPQLVGEVSELAVRRYIDGSAKFGRKFGKTAKTIEKARRRNLERARQDTMRNMAQLHTPLKDGEAQPVEGSAHAETKWGVKEGLAASGSWPWAWALDVDENPPPSSIVSRRDTEEARRLAKIADQAVFMDESAVSGNNLWSLIVNFLTATPERDTHNHGHKHKHQAEGHGHGEGGNHHGDADPRPQDKGKESSTPPAGAKLGTQARRRDRIVSSFARLVTEKKKSQDANASSKAHNEQ